MPVSSKDFHGDCSDQEIAIIGTNRKLRDKVQVNFLEQSREFLIKCGFSAQRFLMAFGRFAFTFKGSFASPDRIMSSGGVVESFSGRHAPHSGELLFGSVAKVNPVFFEDSLNGSWADVEFIRDSTHSNSEGVFFDDIISVERKQFSGHVYNLQTEQSIYFAGDVINHNCRSTYVFLLEDEFAALDEGGTQASQFGPVSQEETYYSWLKQQSAEFQNFAIGPTHGKLLRNGGLSADQFQALRLDKNFKPLTLQQMQDKRPAAFTRAGIELGPGGLPLG